MQEITEFFKIYITRQRFKIFQDRQSYYILRPDRIVLMFTVNTVNKRWENTTRCVVHSILPLHVELSDTNARNISSNHNVC